MRSPNAFPIVPLLLVGLLLAGLFHNAVAQPSVRADSEAGARILTGVWGEYFQGWQSARIPVFAGSNGAAEFQRGYSQRTGLGGVVMLPASLCLQLGLSLGFGMDYQTGTFETPAGILLVPDPRNGQPLELDHTYRLTSAFRSVYCDMLAQYQPVPGLGVVGGARIGYRYQSVLSQSDVLPGAGEFRFNNGLRERSMQLGIPFVPARTLLGGVLGLDLTFAVSSRISILARTMIAVDLLSPASGLSWNSIDGGGGLGLIVDLTPHEQNSAVPPVADLATDSTPADLAPRNQFLHASLDITGIDSLGMRTDAATVEVEEVVSRRLTPIDPVIRFRPGSADLRDFYVALSSDEAASFRLDSLVALNAYQTRRQLPNIIGFRLKREPSVSIALQGSATVGERPTIAGDRASTLRRYLIDVWGIDGSRIAVAGHLSSGPRGKVAGGRTSISSVRIRATTGSIAQPLMYESVETRFRPPLIRLAPDIRSSEGIRSWRVTLRQGERALAVYAGSGSNVRIDSAVRWRVGAGELADSSVLSADLTVEDSSGATAHVRGETPMRVIRRARMVFQESSFDGARESISYALFPAREGSMDVSAENRGVVREIVSSMAEGEKVRVEVRGGDTVALATQIRNLLDSLLGGGHIRPTVVVCPTSPDVALYGSGYPAGSSNGVEVMIVVTRQRAAARPGQPVQYEAGEPVDGTDSP